MSVKSAVSRPQWVATAASAGILTAAVSLWSFAVHQIVAEPYLVSQQLKLHTVASWTITG